MARLIISNAEGRQERALRPHNTLGRHPDNTIQILDRIVSKEHCHIDERSGQWFLKDLGSLNGTWVNGERVDERALRTGDQITMGSTTIVFEADAAPAAASAAAAGVPKITVDDASTDSHIRTRIGMTAAQLTFMPEAHVKDVDALRQDYEKLRISHEVMNALGGELDVPKLLEKILDCAFELLRADRGVILAWDDEGQLKTQCVRARHGSEESVSISKTILAEVVHNKAAVLSSDASVDERFQGAHSVIMQGIRSTMAVPLLHGEDLFGIMFLDSQMATNAFTEKDLHLFENIARQAAIAIQNSLYAKKLEQEAVTRERFLRLLSPDIADQVLSGKLEVKKGGELRETTVLFSDIRGFTSMSETRDPQSVVEMLNEYFELMVEIIFRHEGTLDKFVGDEIMALFGSPVSHKDDAHRAVRTGLEMMHALSEFNRTRESEGEIPIQIGIGINSGEVVAGYLGSSRALEYTVIGDVVNTGARLCSLAKSGEVIISEATYARVKDRFDTQALPAAPVKGKAQPLKIYRVLRERPGVYIGRPE
ncbi:MAG: FHA domain-containing protein [Myxococcales bacterium]|nr:FHA domain-containing protein [Myxococcales bacterium]